jgi:hypothetical protein
MQGTEIRQELAVVRGSRVRATQLAREIQLGMAREIVIKEQKRGLGLGSATRL